MYGEIIAIYCEQHINTRHGQNVWLYVVQRVVYLQSVTGGMCQTSGECSLGQTIPI